MGKNVSIKVISSTFPSMVPLFRCFSGFLLKDPKLLPFFRKAPIEELDQIEAQAMHDPAHNPHGAAACADARGCPASTAMPSGRQGMRSRGRRHCHPPG